MEAPEVICYDIRSFFKESPCLSRCPACATPLKEAAIPPSAPGKEFRKRATIPLLETTLYTCSHCDWWAIREVRVDCELIDGVADYLVTLNMHRKRLRRAATEQNDTPEQSPLWQLVVDEISYWQESQSISPQVAHFLFGQQNATDKIDKQDGFSTAPGGAC